MSGVEIRVRSNSAQARNDLNRLNKSMNSIDSRVKNISRSFIGLAGSVGAAFGIRGVTRSINGATDSLTNMENRIALVTGRNKEMNKTLDSLYKIAKNGRQPVDAAAETFNRFGVSLKAAGESTEDILKAIDSVTKATTISGGSAESARAALFQLGQGLASGQLRGQELNSVLEQAPRLARAIADSMGEPQGALRDLAKEGKITTEVVFEALLDQSEALNEEFELMEVTSAQAMTVLRDQIKRVTAEVSRELNITGSFVTRVQKLTDAIEANRTEIVRTIVENARAIKSSFSGVLFIGERIIDIIQRLYANFSANSEEILKPLEKAGEAFLATTKDIIATVTKAYQKGFRVISNLYEDTFLTANQRIVRMFRGSAMDALDDSTRMYKNIGMVAAEGLKTAWDAVNKYLTLIERKFFWVYDEVIGNSWWTDTMEMTFSLAQEFLGKTESRVKAFASKIVEYYRIAKDKIEPILDSIGNYSSKITADIDFSGLQKVIENPLKFAMEDGLGETIKAILGPLSETGAAIYNSIKQASPTIAAVIAGAALAGLTAAFFPAAIAGTLTILKLGIIGAIGTSIGSSLFGSLSDSGFFGDMGVALGKAAGSFVAFLIDSIPDIITGFFQFISAFGKEMRDQIGGVIGGLLTLLPGSGLISGILFGSMTLAVFSSSFRGLIGTINGQFGSLVQGTTRRIGATGAINQWLYGATGARGGLATVGVGLLGVQSLFATFTSDAEASLFDYVLSGGMIGYALFGEQNTIALLQRLVAPIQALGVSMRAAFAASGLAGLQLQAALVFAQISATATAAYATVTAAAATAYASITAFAATHLATATAFFAGFGVKASLVFGLLRTRAAISMASVAASVRASMAVATVAVSRFSAFSIGRFGRIAALVGLATAAMTGMASAEGLDGEGIGSQFGLEMALGAASFVSLFPTIIADGLKLAFNGIKRVLVGLFGGLIRQVSRMIVLAVGTAVAGVLSIPASIVAAIVSAISALTLGYLFWEPITSGLENFKNNVLDYFGLIDRSILKTRRNMLDTSKDIEKRLSGDFKLRLVSKLEDLNLSNADNAGLRAIDKSVKELDKASRKAEKEKAQFGAVTEGTRKEIKALTKELVKEARGAAGKEGGTNSNATVLTNFTDALFKDVEAQSVSTILAGILGRDTRTPQQRLKQEFEDGQFNLEDRSQRAALAARLQMDFYDELTDLNQQGNPNGSIPPGAMMDVINRLANDDGKNEDIDLSDLANAISDVLAFNQQSFLQKFFSGDQQNFFSQQALSDVVGKTLVGDDAKRVLSRRREIVDAINKDSNLETGNQGDLGLSLSELNDIAVKMSEIAKIRKAMNIQELPTKPDELRTLTAKLIEQGLATGEEIDNLEKLEEALKRYVFTASNEMKKLGNNLPSINQSLESFGFGALPYDTTGISPDKRKDNRDRQNDLFSDLSALETVAFQLGELPPVELANASEIAKIAQLTGEMEDFKKSIERTLATIATNSLGATDRIGLLNSALSGIDDKTFDMNKVLAIKPETLAKVVEAQLLIANLQLQLDTAFAGNTLDADLAKSLTKGIKEQQDRITKLMKPFGTATGEAAKTALEKVLEGLSDSGYNFNLEEISTFGKSSLDGLSKLFAEEKKLRKELAKLPLVDEDGRRKTSKRLAEIREEVRGALLTVQADNNFALSGVLDNLGGGSLEDFFSMGDGYTSQQQHYLHLLEKIRVAEIKLANSREEGAAEAANELERLRMLQTIMFDNAIASSNEVTNSIGSSISRALKEDMSLSTAFDSILETLSNTIIDTVVSSFTTAFITSAGLDTFFTNMFSNLGTFFFGQGLSIGKETKEGVTDALGGDGGFFSKLFDSLPESLTGFFDTLKGGFSDAIIGFGKGLGQILGGEGGALAGWLGNISGGDGFFSGIAGSIGGFLGFSQGGIVPNTSYSRAGRDSVPAMLTPGELVIPQNKIDDVLSGRAVGNNGGSMSTFNLNIQGDVTRQTRKEIVRMMPEIANGVNNTNKENNFRGR